MNNNKKIILLIIRKSYAELDWILPILKGVKKKYRIYTYFNSKESYENIKSSKYIYKKWKDISDKYYIQKKSEAILIRSLVFILKYISFFNLKKIFNFLNNKINKTIYSQKKFCEFYNEKNNVKPKIIFNSVFEASGGTGWIETFKNQVLIVRYPHSTQIHSNYNKDKIYKNKNKYIKKYLLLTGSNHDIPGLSKHWNPKNIKVIGYPRYEKNWLKKIRKYKKENNNIGVSLKNFQIKERSNFKNLISSILIISKEIKNCKVIFKLHPSQKFNKFLDLMKDFDHKNWEISDENIFSVASKSSVFLAYHRSSTILDAIAIGIPTIKLWSVKVVDKDNHVIRFGINKSIYTELGLAPVAHSFKDLKSYINLAINDPSNKIWIKQKLRFKKICQNINTMKSLNEELLKHGNF